MSYIRMFNGQKTFNFQWGVTLQEGGSSHFSFPFALEFCIGTGVDVGCHQQSWKFPGAIPIDPALNQYDALHIPYQNLDYIFSSHTLEHIQNWQQVLKYWNTILRKDGVLFLYLPDYSMPAWRPQNNPEHKQLFTQQQLKTFLQNNNYYNVSYSGVDLNNSFIVVGQRKE